MPARAMPLASVGRIISMAGLKCLRMGAAVKALFNFQNPNLASQVQSHFSCSAILDVSAFFSRSDVGVVAIVFFLVN
jgi:hypothetical protein